MNAVEIDGEKYIKESEAYIPCEYDFLRYAIVRSREQGVMSGYVYSINGRTVILKRARQLWSYDSRFVLPDLAEHGVSDAKKCKFSCEMSRDMVMLEACGVIYCTKKAAESIISVKATNNE